MNKHDALKLFFGLGKEAKETLKNCENPLSIAGRNPQGDRSLKIDIELEDIVKKKIGNNTLITEETLGKAGGGDIFVLDPLDGSENLFRKIPVYAFAICMAPEGSATTEDIEVSYVLDLVTGDEYHAVKGEGAYLNGKRLSCEGSGKANLISVNPGTDPEKASRLVNGMTRLGWIRIFGACIMDMCMLARGSINAFVDVRDGILVTHAPALLIAKESGAIVTGAKGENISTPLKNGATFSVVAANDAELHRDILRIIKEQSGMV